MNYKMLLKKSKKKAKNEKERKEPCLKNNKTRNNDLEKKDLFNDNSSC